MPDAKVRHLTEGLFSAKDEVVDAAVFEQEWLALFRRLDASHTGVALGADDNHAHT